MSPTYGKELLLPMFMNDWARAHVKSYEEKLEALSPSLDGAERVRLARLARFQRSSTATRKNNSPGTL